MARACVRRRLIRVGSVRAQHSPQRTANSFGLVIERERAPHELDGLRWYTDFETCDRVLWERYFHCADLGRDLVPVVEAFRASPEFASGVPGPDAVCIDPPLTQDVETVPPPPFSLSQWLEAHAAELARGASLDLFPGVPTDLHVRVAGGPAHEALAPSSHETWLHQLRGDATLYQLEGSGSARAADVREQLLPEGSCGVVPAGVPYSIRREAGTYGLVAARTSRTLKSGAAAPGA